MREIKLDNLTVQYPFGATAISRLTLQCQKGEIYTVLCGEEGGKTSLAKAIAGIAPVGEGKIYLDDKRVERLSTKERNVCLLTADSFFEKKTVRENLTFPLKIRGIAEPELSKTIHFALEKTGSLHLVDQKIKTLNSYQRMKILFARAYLRIPNVYLIDNPLKNVTERADRFSEVIGYMEELKNFAPVIYTTTEGAEALKIGGPCALLRYGIPIQLGSANSFLACPASLAALEFFYPDIVTEEVDIVKKGTEVFVQRESNADKIHPNLLLCSDYIGCRVYVARLPKGELFLYDINCERMVYPIY